MYLFFEVSYFKTTIATTIQAIIIAINTTAATASPTNLQVSFVAVDTEASAPFNTKLVDICIIVSGVGCLIAT